MTIAVLSDTHMHHLTDEFRRRVEELAGEVDHFFHLGDSVSPEILGFLNSFSLYAVAGNMDPMSVRSSWPEKRIVELEGCRFGLVHGWGSGFGLDKRVAALFDDVDCVCFGHSHRTLNRRHDKALLFNPGSAKPGAKPQPTYGRLEVTSEGITGRHLPF